MRTFLAVEMPRPVRMHLGHSIEGMKQKDMPIKWVKPENMHITLKFLGEIDEQQQLEISPIIKQIASQHEAFAVNLKGVGCFPQPAHPRVLWVGVEQGNEALCTLAREIDEQLSRVGFKKEKRFHPHITIARIKKACVVDDILKHSVATDTFTAGAVTFFKSILTPQGPIYKALERFPFSGVKSQH